MVIRFEKLSKPHQLFALHNVVTRPEIVYASHNCDSSTRTAFLERVKSKALLFINSN